VAPAVKTVTGLAGLAVELLLAVRVRAAHTKLPVLLPQQILVLAVAVAVQVLVP
jgi:hypothetical protein